MPKDDDDAYNTFIWILIDDVNNISTLMTLKLASGSYDNTIRFWDPSTCSSNPK